ncbi:hypothetical protein [Hydrogenimonas sp.]
MKKYFLNFPYFLKFLIVNIYGIKLSKNRYTKAFYNFLKYYISLDRCEEFHFDNRKLTEQIKNHPYYHKFLDTPIEQFPIINKTYIKNNYGKLFDKRYLHSYLHTSGTTGSGLTFPVSKIFLEHQWAVFWKFRKIHGLTLDTWWANIVGQTLFKIEQKKPPFWIKSFPTKQLLMSSYHLRKNTFELYMNAIKKEDIHWLHGYPSVLNEFANLVTENGLTQKAQALRLEIITTSSEKLHEYQKQNISKVFGCPVRQLYGLVEGVANIFECEHGTLHIDESYSYVELIPINKKNNEFKIVGTSYHNPAFPLIRYDTGDTCILYNNTFKCSCGRKSRIVKEILGREEDYLMLSDGTKIGRLSPLFKSSLNIKEAQIYQTKPGSAEFRIVKNKNYEKKDEDELISQIKEKLGEDFDYKIVYYKKIPRTKKGKLRLVINEIPKTT